MSDDSPQASEVGNNVKSFDVMEFIKKHPVISLIHLITTLVGIGIGYNGVLFDVAPIKGAIGGAIFGGFCGFYITGAYLFKSVEQK